jgi:hypothetical protein
MSVVQRCPNCGTTKSTSGECDACHEATVRYFCTNHTPGLWLDTRTCPKCGAQLGEPAHRASAAAPALPARKRRPRPPASTPAPPPPGADELEAGASSPTALLQKMLRAAVSARYMSRRAAPRREKLPIGGCLMRLVLLVLFMLAALAGGLFLFGRALLY